MAGVIADSGNLSWNTPDYLLEKIRVYFNGTIDLDPCSNPGSIVQATDNWVLPYRDGLEESWGERKRVYVNPPYGSSYILDGRCLLPKEYRELPPEKKIQCKKQNIFKWVSKAVSEREDRQNETIMLIPASVETKAWQDIIFKQNFVSVCFLKGRVRFVGSINGCSVPLALVLFSQYPLQVGGYKEAIAKRKSFNKLFSDLGFIF